MNPDEQRVHKSRMDALEARMDTFEESERTFTGEVVTRMTAVAQTVSALSKNVTAELAAQRQNFEREMGETREDLRTELLDNHQVLQSAISAVGDGSVERNRSWRLRWRWLLKGY